MAHISGAVTLKREVPAFQDKIGGEDKIFLRAWPQNGAIVTNAFDDGLILIASGREFANTIDELSFAHTRANRP
jgi:hypothetical protein